MLSKINIPLVYQKVFTKQLKFYTISETINQEKIMSMTEIDFIREGMKALQPGLPAPKYSNEVQDDMQSTERLRKFVEYIRQHHPALFEHAYKEASK
jgi:hypothetical protein